MKSQLATRVSEEEFLSWPATMQRIELIDGEVIAQSAATYGHQEALGRLVHALRTWATGRGVTIGQSPCDIRFAPNRVLQPDAFVIVERIPFRTKGPLTRVPEICIEVLSQDLRYDRVTKRLVYAAAGVQELWLVDLGGLVERWSGDGLLAAETITGTLESALLPDFALHVPSLVAED